jgi:hypothetical protein
MRSLPTSFSITQLVDPAGAARHRRPMPSASDLELGFYERFLLAKGLEPYPVQEQAIGMIAAGKSVLVTVPTGTGKTVMAKAAIYAAIERKQTAVYTTPLRALTEEKYRELCADFGEHDVGFATGDYKVNRDAPIQVEVAEILWNRVYGDKSVYPADVVIMDEGHYFNDPERGYVWEQTIIGLDPRVQLVILSATVGRPDKFCHWVELTRRVPMELVDSRERKVPLVHEYKEEPLIDVVRELAHTGDVPAIVFVFGRELCFEVARLLKSCRRFTTDEEKAEIEKRCDAALLPGGVAKELKPLFAHGIGIHHAGIIPRYKQLVEQLALDRLIKFVVSTETIAAGINLPARTVVFPSLRKFIKQEARLVTPAEYHQMAGRAGRPQFDDKGLAIALAPEEVTSELKRELKAAGKRGEIDRAKIAKGIYNRLRSEAQRKGDVLWTPEAHAELVRGEPAELRSRTKITAEQVLAIGLPDLTTTEISSETSADAVERSLPASLRLDIVSVIDNLLLDDHAKRGMQKTLAQLVANLQAIGVLDAAGKQVKGQMIRQLQGMDGPFIYYTLFNHQLDYVDLRAMVEFLVDHDVVQRALDRKGEDKKREWMRAKLKEMREANPQVSWDDVEAEYDKEFPRVPTKIELIQQEFAAAVPHPELHGGKKPKTVWAQMEDESLGFLEFIERHGLDHEEGSLFSYLVRVMNFARKLGEASELEQFTELADKVRTVLAKIDERLVDDNKAW